MKFNHILSGLALTAAVLAAAGLIGSRFLKPKVQ